ncbi:MAG: pirin family protein [Bacteroidetes bacterium]|nr:pirin family protein [Bacteroidota bacterium]
MNKTVFHPADTRGHADHGWLNTYHTFSFAGYHEPERIHFGALRVLNDDTVAGGTGFGKHPHDNMEIITIVLKGALEHQDSMGHTQAIHPGEVQVMSAGTGIFHSEYNHNKDEAVELFQIWIFPDKRNVTPRYDQKMFDAESRKNKVQQLVSSIDNDEEGLKIHQNARISRVSLEAGKEVNYNIKDPKNGLYILMVEGRAKAAEQPLDRRDGYGLAGVDSVSLKAETDSDILLFEVPMYM